MNFHLPTSTAQWVSVVGLGAYAVYQATQGDYNQAITSLMAALAVFGIGSQQAKTQAMTTGIKADTSNMVNDPSYPGTPKR